MKRYKFILSILTVAMLTACSLTEEPPFLSRENVFQNLDNARTGLKGVYKGLSDWKNYSYGSHALFTGFSGYYVKRSFRGLKDHDNQTLYALKPQPNSREVEDVWFSHYLTISRCNDIISTVLPVEDPKSENEEGMNDILGQAYFIRAFEYFNLVRLWGDIPLRLETMNTSNIHKPKSPAKDIYAQIISDAETAKKYIFPVSEQITGFVGKEATNMLLAKVYMALATADAELQDFTPMEYWQKAYDEAIQVYGEYSLVSDYSSLWGETSGDNTPENIFEVQFSDLAGAGMVRFYTPRGATKGNNTWGRVGVNVEIYDDHVATYPGDPRIESDYTTSYTDVVKNKVHDLYPLVARKPWRFTSAFPMPYKYFVKNSNLMTNTNFKNFIIYRYADLLLMLSEISNELQNGEEMKYVTEVLQRVGLSPQQEYSNGQDAFREAIMKEYRYELFGELEGVFTERRRGADWFQTHIIDIHNNASTFDPKIDIKYEVTADEVMHLPIPSSEINTNQEINN